MEGTIVGKILLKGLHSKVEDLNYYGKQLASPLSSDPHFPLELLVKDIVEELKGYKHITFEGNGLVSISYSKFDSEILGLPTYNARVLAFEETRSSAENFTRSLYGYMRKEALGTTKLVFIRINTLYKKLTNVIIKSGGFLTSVLLQFILTKDYWRRIQNTKKILEEVLDRNKILIKTFRKSDEEVLIDITKNTYLHSHYYNSPYINFKAAEEIYRNWIKNSLYGYVDKILIAEYEGQLVGYITLKIRRIHNYKYAVIDLIAINKNHRRKRLGKLLTYEAIKESIEGVGVDAIIVGTQLTNIPAIRTYEWFGFRLASSLYTVHIKL